MSEVVTAADIRQAMETMTAQRPNHCPPHLVHPKYATWEIAEAGEIVRCANLCGWAAFMAPPP